jgi:hypothetical protein
MLDGPQQSRQIIGHGLTICHTELLSSSGMKVIIAGSVQLAQ